MLLKTLTVREVNEYIKKLLSGDIILKNIMIKGEISNLKFHSQALYFTLVDEYASLKCIMFNEYLEKIDLKLENGMSVIATGRISVYEKSGTFEFYVTKIEVEGSGALYVSFEKLKQRLKNEGLFDSDKKIPIPKNPKKIGVITSPTGAAIHDIIKILRRRKPSIDILVVPILVQGNMAALEIEEAINTLNKRRDIDLIILGRGGGSFEDLYPFSEEKVARAIYKSKIPVISAVGHETDFTIADFVADLRAPTPSAAAELAVTDISVYNDMINNYKKSLYHSIMAIINNERQHLNGLKNTILSKNPIRENEQLKIKLKSLNRIMENSIISIINNKKFKYISLVDKLNTLSPLNVLKRGYTVTMDRNNLKPITLAKNLMVDDIVYILFNDGKARCTVNEVEKNE
ncbi:exodeoxyribonuclease VII large subunit [Thermoanaerobacterium sp. RBIITD]|uniref:exodeoxyribonuclease VII large subunit n=1 Tax=Thermoanaerobacterium sp. RBIITD TaxID=1550240 RepID=UPI000BB9767C|nr:exodeoxyribonuclease VII large subunit [Thermoanaerobacterium sp. RBIITD]SNX55369.1 Exodeoxyribonuclease VII large subunit [Thermoanaerobacterium sp. RBIITD]